MLWNPWHGCHKISPGCLHCYMYRRDEKIGKDAGKVQKTKNFDLPIQKKRDGQYVIPPQSEVMTCFTSDFLVEEADPWRQEAWEMIKMRRDCTFFFITKRIHRLKDCLPPDWGKGYENVAIGCTCENQDRADYRIPIFKKAPILHKQLILEPMLEEISLPDLGPWLEGVTVGGESGENVRPLCYDWVLDIRHACIKAQVPFSFHQTGAVLIKDGKEYHIARRLQAQQAKKARIDYPIREKPF